MTTLTLLRHGQASFNSKDYDRLSSLGARQIGRLADHWLAGGTSFDAVFTGTLQRQTQTEHLLASAFREAGHPWPQVTRLEGLNEFPAEKVVRQLAPELCLRDREVRRLYRSYAREREAGDETLMALVKRVCDYWVRGNYATPLAVKWPAFQAQVTAALADLTARLESGERVLAITSGGVISVALQLASGTEMDQAIARNWDIHNGSLTELRAAGGGAFEILTRANVAYLEPDLLTLR